MKKLVMILLIIFTGISLLSIFFSLHNYNPEVRLTGNFFFDTTVAVIKFFVEGGGFIISVDSPNNATYNFSIGDVYTIDLNVSSSESMGSWWYDLYDLRHDKWIVQDQFFTPNATFNASRWSNRIEIYANNSAGSETSNTNVTFFVSVPNSAPIINPDTETDDFACEASSFSSLFNVTDVDEDKLAFDLDNLNPFYVVSYSSGTSNISYGEVFSGILTKDNAGGIDVGSKLYKLKLSANDGEYSDTKDVNITVIEINNQPQIESIGTKTVWTSGDNSTLGFYAAGTDTETANVNLSYNLTFLTGNEFFTINNNSGYMFISPNSSDVGVYSLSTCVIDKGIANPHENISLCNQDGGSLSACTPFTLTVTDDNRAPNITSYVPAELTFNSSGTNVTNYSITVRDPDGTVPDTYWYSDGVLKEIDYGLNPAGFNYSFGCGFSGEHTVKAVITDGLINDSVQWLVNVEYVSCLVNDGGGSGGGGGGGGGGSVTSSCEEKWGCGEWAVCQHAGLSFQEGILTKNEYLEVLFQCSELSLKDDVCGFQIRNCVDVNSCNVTSSSSSEPRYSPSIACYYVKNPTCSDGVKNCHDNSCEVLVDCGGPCNPCPSCSDNIKNQNEKGVDCGGPCPVVCPVKPSVLSENLPAIILVTFISFLLVLIGVEWHRWGRLRKKFKKR